MKKWTSAIIISLLAAIAVLTNLAISLLAGELANVSEKQLQEYLRKYKYPYSEVPPGERVQLAQYAIKTLNEQIAHFQPGQGTTMSYLENALAHMQELLSTSLH